MKATLLIRQAVRPWLAAFTPGENVLIAVSGGADSLALAAGLALESRDLALNLIPLIIDHGLQPGSADVAEATAQQLTRLGFHQIEIRKVNVEITDGLEASARRARYLAFDDALNEFQAKTIFLGHTLNDQAETVLLGLARGSGTRSLSGMAPASADGKYFRPLLGVDRTTTIAACAEQEITFWSDPHNENEEFTRVKIRKNILPLMESQLGPGITDALARGARIAREDADALDQLAAEFRQSHPDLIADELARLPKAIRARVLRSAIYEAGAPTGTLTADHLAPVEALITAWAGQGEVSLPGGVKVSRISGRLSLSTPK
ncbi:MAG: tRNA lysidine(34) synthetase TilS [Actinomycetes bacterium]